VIVAPIETMAALQYASNYIPGLAYHVGNTTHLTVMGIGVAAVFMFLMCCLNMLGAKFFSKNNNVLVCWKLLIPIMAIIFLFTHRFQISHFTQFGGFAPQGLHGILSALPAAGVIFSFIGYSPAIQLAGEAKNPQRAIPLAIIGSISICIVLYIVLQIAFIGAVQSSSLAHGWARMHFIGDAGPVAGIIAGLGLVWFLKLLYIDAVISPFGTAYIYTASTSRMNYAMTENGYMPAWMKILNRKGVPYLAIIVNFIIGMIFFLPFPGWQAMVGFLVSCFVVAYAIGPIACASLRRKLPDQARPFRLPAPYFMSLIAFYVCNLIIYWTSWHVVWRMLLTIAIGYVVLFVYRRVAKKREVLDAVHAIWLLPYFLGLGIISYLGAFDGIHVITLGWDFLVIAIFSIVIFYFAVESGQAEDPELIREIETLIC